MNNTRQADFEDKPNRKSRRRKHFTKAERMQQIEHAVLEHLYMHRKAMSVRQIADAIDMSPSMHLTRIVEDMVADGRLTFKQYDYYGGKCRYRFEYTIPPAKLAAGVAGAIQ